MHSQPGSTVSVGQISTFTLPGPVSCPVNFAVMEGTGGAGLVRSYINFPGGFVAQRVWLYFQVINSQPNPCDGPFPNHSAHDKKFGDWRNLMVPLF